MHTLQHSKNTALKGEYKPYRCPLWKSLLAELIGTFFLTLAAITPVILSGFIGFSQAAKALPAGMVVAALIYVVGPISGAHLNPMVTLAFAVRRSFPLRNVLPYWLMQLLGSLAAAGVMLAMFGNVQHLGATTPKLGDAQALVMECILTFLLVFVILGTAQEHKVAGPNAALAVGMTIALGGMIGGAISGGSMNPARSFGPALLGDSLSSYWIYVAGPLAGALLASLIAWFLHGPPRKDEVDAAQGKEVTES